jgi:putative ABC transport system substrate-binding protein
MAIKNMTDAVGVPIQTVVKAITMLPPQLRGTDMQRRAFLVFLGGAAVWPVVARAQTLTAPVVGFLGLAPASGSAGRVEALRTGLRDLGYVEGDNLAIEFRWAENPDQLRQFAADLVQHRVTAIVTSGNIATVAAKSATSSIPIIFSVADDPVRLGLVASFNKPGGNITGVSLISGTLGPKRIELLRELVPATNLIAMLVNPTNPAEVNQREEQAAASAIGQRILVLTATAEPDIEAAFATLVSQHAGAIIINADSFFTAHRDKIIGLAAHYKIPVIYPWREYAEAGGLMSYGTSFADSYRQVGVYVGRVLRGVKPADLPVTQPTRIELVINLTTAKTLGLAISAKLLALSDAVVE